jgi:aminoglycoside phosphotransferase (APT) family kinase protein
VTLQSPDAGEIDSDRVKKDLLELLRTEADTEEAEFTVDPVRLLGGFDTLIFSFRLSKVPEVLAGPLVIRLFAEMGGVGQSAKEAVFQNAMADAGYPVPRVVIPGGTRTINGRPFNVMERVQAIRLWKR